ncbi:MAG: tRNA uridine-5-carboxymethylaminomethyl(34) synthesis GTPase MnmE [Alphaproteobacteria bacterium]|nr:tRNA uridine-5-carboxymethylaminomethyl(34) synthesis GTPase MnmE [Alphaproteobacteria bacterium SS10]
MTDTIFALASAPGRAGVAVMRLSGPDAADALAALTPHQVEPPARLASLRRLMIPGTDTAIDEALVIRFEAPASFTGEHVVELHLHGGRAIIDTLASTLATLPGLRLAMPGEFTRRAFENGRLDLTEAEAVADLINAETEAQRLQALDQLGGALKSLYQGWADRLTRSMAHLEADIDFPDEDLPDGIVVRIKPGLDKLIAEIDAHLADNRRGERLRDGVSIAILGAPNAGKSSLLNAIAARDAAIVSDIAGTTRDAIEVHLDLGGYPVTLIDTAGLRETEDTIESEGIRRALARADQADLKLIVVDAAELSQTSPRLPPMLDAMVDAQTLIALNKTDLALNPATGLPIEFGGRPAIAVSAKTGDGLDNLLHALQASTADSLGKASAGPTLTRARHREALQECRDSLQRAKTAPAPELAAEDTRLALRALGRITGRVDVEDLLDVIFRDFCIGK